MSYILSSQVWHKKASAGDNLLKYFGPKRFVRRCLKLLKVLSPCNSDGAWEICWVGHTEVMMEHLAPLKLLKMCSPDNDCPLLFKAYHAVCEGIVISLYVYLQLTDIKKIS